MKTVTVPIFEQMKIMYKKCINNWMLQERITKDSYLEQLSRLVEITKKSAFIFNMEDINFVSQIVSNVWTFVDEDDMNFIGVMHNKV